MPVIGLPGNAERIGLDLRAKKAAWENGSSSRSVSWSPVYLLIATSSLRLDSVIQRVVPPNGLVTFDRFLALTPALLVVAISNRFEEEFLFRGLFL